ncbi:MAG: hypothetical protein K8R87_09840 [Verrucomicrobia bacterium]|nr:hypothetical protein [Verrucomicrobiota bacterium]
MMKFEASTMPVIENMNEGDDEHHSATLMIEDEAEIDGESAQLDEGKEQARGTGDIRIAQQEFHGADPDDDRDQGADDVRGVLQRTVQQQDYQR